MSTAILFSNHFLSRCEALARLYALDTEREGLFLARGFADLGYELFLSLPRYRVSSFFTGSVSDCPPEARAHFFRVPLADDLLELLVERNMGVKSVRVLPDGVGFELLCEDGFQASSERGTFLEALLDLAIERLGSVEGLR